MTLAPGANREGRHHRAQRTSGEVLALVVVLTIGAGLGALGYLRFPAFERVLQEDGVVEWATFWSFVAAAAVHARAAYRGAGSVAWWWLALAALCAFVAAEEISWGQRVWGYVPPELFLAHNFQQELNVHNLAGESARAIGLTAAVGGYGIVLPVVARLRAPAQSPWWDDAARRLALVPAFAAALAAFWWYPLPYTGEVVELMLGFAFLFSAPSTPGDAAGEPAATRRMDGAVALRPSMGGVLAAAALVAAVSTASAVWSLTRSDGAALRHVASADLHALAVDLLVAAERNGTTPTGCNLHKRVYSFVTAYGVDDLRAGAFAARARHAGRGDRIRYFIDPWSSPYWVRDQCSRNGRRRSAFVYSFGPNRRRESSPWRVGGDDVGVHLTAVDPSARARARSRVSRSR